MKELNVIPYKNMCDTYIILKKNEEIKFYMEATCDKSSGYVILTNKRIIFKGKEESGPIKIRHYEYFGFEFELSEITTIEYPINIYSGERLYSRILIQWQSRFIKIIAKNGSEEMKQFYDTLFNCIEQYSQEI